MVLRRERRAWARALLLHLLLSTVAIARRWSANTSPLTPTRRYSWSSTGGRSSNRSSRAYRGPFGGSTRRNTRTSGAVGRASSTRPSPRPGRRAWRGSRCTGSGRGGLPRWGTRTSLTTGGPTLRRPTRGPARTPPRAPFFRYAASYPS